MFPFELRVAGTISPVSAFFTPYDVEPKPTAAGSKRIVPEYMCSASVLAIVSHTDVPSTVGTISNESIAGSTAT